MTAWGADACRAGWVWLALAGDDYRYGLDARFADLAARLAPHDRLLVDIPIGLPEPGDVRDCDREARRRLGPRASSVFSAPPALVLDAPDHATAVARSRAAGGAGIPIQTWNIVPRIAEVDGWLAAHPEDAARIHEAHPELGFRALNGGAPVMEPKRRRAGFEQRLALLMRAWPRAEEAIAHAWLWLGLAGAGRDDVLDAAVNALTAMLPEERIEMLPDAAATDRRGRPMRMVCPEP
jgi:predicted RNase H-like nuclease